MPREKTSIIVTCAGTASAISVIKSLKEQQELPVHIVAVDVDPMAAGLFLSDEHRLVPLSTHPDYIATLIDISRQTGASVVIPIFSEEIKLIAQNKGLLEQHGIRTLLSSPETIDLCNDKKAMYAFAQKAGLSVPLVYQATQLAHPQLLAYPVFVKPNTGSSSSGAEKVENASRLMELMNSGKDLVVQQFMEAPEVTVDVFCNRESQALVISPRLRLSTKSGQSVKGKTLDAGLFKETIRYICNTLEIRGVCNVQFFMKDQSLYFIELNPRFAAGGLMLTVKAGANIPLLLLKSILNKPINEEECMTKPNYLMTRFWEEIIFQVEM